MSTNELNETHKIGDKVTIVKGPKDVKGKEGRIGEIRKQAYKSAPRTYTVDYDHHETTGARKSIQLPAKHIKGMKEQTELQEKHRVAITLSDPKHPDVSKRTELIKKTVRVNSDNPGHAVDSAIHHFRKSGYKVHDHKYIGTIKEEAKLDELSTNTLASYKTKAHASAKASDQAGDYTKGDKRFKGINKATNKQFDNDLKKHGQYKKEDLDEGLGRGREDDEYHTPDPVKHAYKFTVSKDGGEKHDRTVTTGLTTKSKASMHPIAKAHLEKQGYKIHESADLEESRGLADKYYKMAQDRKETAHENKGNHEVYHTHMADHHDHMSRYHEELGQHSLAQAHADKADIHHEKSMKKNEEAPVNNVGGGNIAGTQGDAGKKVVMTKKPMKRQTFKEFTETTIELTADEQFDLIEDLIQELAAKNNVDADAVWEDLESVDDEELFEYAIDAKGHKSSTGGLTQKGVDAYNAKTGGNLKTAVTTKPSKLKPGSKAANRRKSFCARMGGMKKRLTSAKTANDPDSRINKALRKWNC